MKGEAFKQMSDIGEYPSGSMTLKGWHATRQIIELEPEFEVMI